MSDELEKAQMSDKQEEKIEKIVPSKLENAMYKFAYKYLGEKIPENVTPNQITLLGALSGLLGIICASLSGISIYFLIGTIVGISGHLICDDLDGYVARKRNMTSKAGGYFDLLTDIVHITYLIVAFAFTGILSAKIAVVIAPVYALLIFTSMNSILHLKKFPFPRVGPIETHLFFIAICVVSMVFGTDSVVTLGSLELNIADLICVVGGIPMYYEMIRLQIELFRDLQKVDKEGK